MIESLIIERYRGINRLEMKNLRQLNLLVGGNNSGKSSVLEAVGLAISNQKPLFMAELLKSRLTTERNFNLNHFFYDLEHERNIRITLTKTDGRTDAYILELGSDEERSVRSPFRNNEKLLIIMGPDDLRMAIWDSEYRERRLLFPPFRVDRRNCYFIGNNYNPDLYNLVSKSLESNYDKELLEAARITDQRILDLITLNDSLYANIGTSKRLPINVMGDGIKRIISIVSALLNLTEPDSVLLIDEIDTGLHYSALTRLWKTVLGTLKMRPDVQIFATTHSDESVRALYEILLEEYADNPDLFPVSLQRLERGADCHYATAYSPEVTLLSLEKNYEYR